MSESPAQTHLSPHAPQIHGLLRFSHDAMACTFQVFTPADDARAARGASDEAFAEIDRLDQELSRFVRSSDVGRVNTLAAGESVRVGIELIDCLELAARVAAETGGAFDVGYRGRAGGADEQQPRLHVDRASRTVFASTDHPDIDLGGIGKGYAVDRAADVLRDWGIRSALIHSGQSTLLALGRAPNGEPWRIAIRDPRNDRPDSPPSPAKSEPEAPARPNRDDLPPLGVVTLTNRALSGSGMALHGQHIIDPRCGAPARGALGAWAVAPDAAWSDALSTAFMVLREDEVAAYCDEHQTVGAIVLPEHAHGILRTFGAANLSAMT